MTPHITLRGPGDVLAVLPFQLGYHPRSCVVAVSLRGRTVGLVARTDLPPDDHVDEAVATLVGPLRRDGATSVIVIGYEDQPEASQPALLALVEHLEEAAVEVVDVVVVRDGRRYSPICSDPCCPPDGVPLPEPADVPAVAEFVARGRAPLASRDAVEGLVAPRPEQGRGVADAVSSRSRMPRRRRRAAVAWRLVLRHEGEAVSRGQGGTPSWRPQVVADAALGLGDIAWRDGLVAWLAPGVLPMSMVDRDVVALLHATLPTWGGMGGRWSGAGSGRPDLAGGAQQVGGRGKGDHGHGEDERGHGEVNDGDDGEGREGGDDRERAALLHRLLELCRAVPDECPREAAAVCTVAAHVAWVEGDGALARAAVDRALRLAPDYTLAQLLLRLIDCGMRPPRRRPGQKQRLGRAG